MTSLSGRPPPHPGRGWSGKSEATGAVRDPGVEGRRGGRGGTGCCGLSWKAAPARRGRVCLSEQAWSEAPEPRGPAQERETRCPPPARYPVAAHPHSPPPLPPPRLGNTGQNHSVRARRPQPPAAGASFPQARALPHPRLGPWAGTSLAYLCLGLGGSARWPGWRTGRRGEEKRCGSRQGVPRPHPQRSLRTSPMTAMGVSPLA